MPGPGEPPARQQALIVGRDAALARLRGLVAPAPQSSEVLLVIGEAGMGKTVLLADAAGRARSAGTRVLSVTGRESESRLAFAGLHQLLRPVLSSAASLPGRQAQALLGAFGLAADPGAPDPLLTGVAVLTLLSDLSERSPVLVVADDAQWIDRGSLEALAFAGSRLDAERVVLLVGARGQAPPPGFGRGFPELRLEPLSAADAGLLLDGQPRPPRGQARLQVLAQASGNPMALVELATVIADDPAASRRWAAEPLPLTDRLSAVITSRFAALPEPARAALLLGAVADGPDLRVAASHGTGPDARALAPAEQLGLVQVNRAGLQFSHPLVRSAIYHSAPFAQRAAAHRQLAEALHDQPDRRAWHLAAAALQPDEQVASLLEATAAQAQRRGGAAAAALAMERAAELSPDRANQARRLVAAATAAVPTGQGDWVQELAKRALEVAADPELRLTARHDAAWALAWSGRRGAALSALLAVAEEASRDRPALAWDALGSAATVAYQSGAPAGRQAVDRVLARLERQGPPPPGPIPGIDVDVLRLWIRVSADPADQWPFERAQLRLDHAEWLRRHRRINDAKAVLTQAVGTFRRLGARSWAERAQAELRACGVPVARAPGQPDALGELTPQQRQIVRLASDGLTDREIGDRLFLSPRTVSSHLYRSYPKLGVASRHQLRDLIAQSGTAAAPPSSGDVQ